MFCHSLNHTFFYENVFRFLVLGMKPNTFMFPIEIIAFKGSFITY